MPLKDQGKNRLDKGGLRLVICAGLSRFTLIRHGCFVKYIIAYNFLGM